MTRRRDQLAPPSAAALLAAWRQAERARALLVGAPAGAAMHAHIRQLIEVDAWVARGSVRRCPHPGVGTRDHEAATPWPP